MHAHEFSCHGLWPRVRHHDKCIARRLDPFDRIRTGLFVVCFANRLQSLLRTEHLGTSSLRCVALFVTSDTVVIHQAETPSDSAETFENQHGLFPSTDSDVALCQHAVTGRDSARHPCTKTSFTLRRINKRSKSSGRGTKELVYMTQGRIALAISFIW